MPHIKSLISNYLCAHLLDVAEPRHFLNTKWKFYSISISVKSFVGIIFL